MVVRKTYIEEKDVVKMPDYINPFAETFDYKAHYAQKRKARFDKDQVSISYLELTQKLVDSWKIKNKNLPEVRRIWRAILSQIRNEVADWARVSINWFWSFLWYELNNDKVYYNAIGWYHFKYTKPRIRLTIKQSPSVKRHFDFCYKWKKFI